MLLLHCDRINAFAHPSGKFSEMSAAEFVQEIRANPDDDTPRLIYADYLEEQGDPRGEFVRVQVELTSLPQGHPEKGGLMRREQELLDAHAEDWLEPIRSLGVDGVSRACFHGGLIEKARMTTAAFTDNGAELCEIEPALHRIQLREAVQSLDQLASLSLPNQVRELDLTANRLGLAEIEYLISAPWTQQIESLILAFNQLGDAGVVQLIAGTWPRLRSLNLDANQITAAGHESLKRSELAGRLDAVSLKANQF